MMSNPTIFDKINVKFIPPLPPKSRMGKWRVSVAFARLHPLYIYIFFGGGGGGRWGIRVCCSIYFVQRIAILDKINGKFISPLAPKSRMGKWRGSVAFARFHPRFGGMGVCCSILL